MSCLKRDFVRSAQLREISCDGPQYTSLWNRRPPIKTSSLLRSPNKEFTISLSISHSKAVCGWEIDSSLPVFSLSLCMWVSRCLLVLFPYSRKKRFTRDKILKDGPMSYELLNIYVPRSSRKHRIPVISSWNKGAQLQYKGIPHNKGFWYSHFICNLYQYIQKIVYKRIQWHVEECSVALLCN
jgi:hypothetical protein